jgi:AcrR family transcriptional regulator
MRRKNITSEMMMNYIAEGLLKLMSDKPYAKISVSDICEKAGVNRSTYYRHFYTKEDIIRYYLDGIMNSYLLKFRDSGEQTIEGYLGIMFSEFMQNKDNLLLIHREQLSYLLIDVLNKHFSVSDISDTADRFRTAYHIGGIYNDLLLWFSHGMTETAEEMVRYTMKFQIPSDVSLFRQ